MNTAAEPLPHNPNAYLLTMALALLLGLAMYVTMPVARGLALLMVCMLPLVGLFEVTPRHVMLATVAAVAGLLLCTFGLWRLDPEGFQWLDDGMSALMVACMTLAVGWMTRSLNARQEAQRQHQRALRDTLDHLQKQATKDLQTGLPNQAYMREWMRQAAKRAQRSGQPLTLALMARDQAKPVSLSHPTDTATPLPEARDELAFDQWVAAANRVFRENDVTARWSSEELLVLFEGCPPDLAKEGLARLRHEADSLAFSSGVLAWLPGEEIDVAMVRARDALQLARQRGGQHDELV
jgi:GGDEF domain-containing protein